MAFKDKVSDFGKAVVQKSGEFAESSKLTMAIKKKEKEVKTTTFEIGSYVYEQYKNGAVFDEKIAEFCKAIDVMYEEIEVLEAEKEAVGIDDLEVEVVEASVSEEDFQEVEEEILNEL